MRRSIHRGGCLGLGLGLLMAAVVLTASAVAAKYEDPAIPYVTWDDVLGWIDEDAAAYGVPALYLRAVAWCESQGNPYAVGRAGEVGVFQFHPYGIWSSMPQFRDETGAPRWDYVSNVRRNVAAGVYAFANGFGRYWSCA